MSGILENCAAEAARTSHGHGGGHPAILPSWILVTRCLSLRRLQRSHLLPGRLPPPICRTISCGYHAMSNLQNIHKHLEADIRRSLELFRVASKCLRTSFAGLWGAHLSFRQLPMFLSSPFSFSPRQRTTAGPDTLVHLTKFPPALVWCRAPTRSSSLPIELQGS